MLTKAEMEDLLCLVALYKAAWHRDHPTQPRPDLEALQHSLEVAIRADNSVRR